MICADDGGGGGGDDTIAIPHHKEHIRRRVFFLYFSSHIFSLFLPDQRNGGTTAHFICFTYLSVLLNLYCFFYNICIKSIN